jgi:hypothetical protein
MWALADVAAQIPVTTRRQADEKLRGLLAILVSLPQAIERAERIELMIRRSVVPTLTSRQVQEFVAGLVDILHEFVPADRLDEAVRQAGRLGTRVTGSLEPLPGVDPQ